MSPSELVRRIRRESGLSLRALARAAGVATSTVHRIERGDINPTLDVLDRVAQAAGMGLIVEPRLDHAASLIGLARSILDDLVRPGSPAGPVRMEAELAHRFATADAEGRRRMLSATPPSTGDQRWDAFVAALAEWLAVRAGVATPRWVHDADRYLPGGWWVSALPSMHAWEYAGSPVSFQSRGVYIHRDSLVNV